MAQSNRQVTAQVKNDLLVRERRRQIVDAAIEVIGRKGYHSTTVRDIVEQSGLTPGTLYNYVRTKDDILFLVCEHLVSIYHDAVTAAASHETHPLRRLKAAIRAPVEVMQTHQDNVLLLYTQAHALDAESRRPILARVREFITLMEDILRDAADAGYIHLQNASLTANIVTFLPAMMALRRWDLRRHVPEEEVVDGLTAFLMQGLGVQESDDEGDGS